MRSFPDIIRDLRSGRTIDQLNDSLQEIVLAVQEHNKPGELALTIKINPNGEGSVTVLDQIKVKIPEPKRPATFFFLTSDGSLVRRDPMQSELPLREVEAATPAETKNLKEA